MSRSAGWISIGLVIALAACGHKKDAPGRGGASARGDRGAATATFEAGRLFAESELAAYEAELSRHLEANVARRCPGPRVRGAATPGPSAPDLVALIEPTGELAACAARLASPAAGNLREGFEARLPALVALEKECGPTVEAAVHQASAHEDGCSPYQIGVRPEPADLLTAMRFAHLLGFRARLLGEQGDPARALALIVDGLRLYQDLQRGHVTLISGMVATASMEILGAQADRVLDDAKLSPDQLTELATALDRLIAATPAFADLMAGEREQIALYGGMAPLHDASWTPPGGWNEQLRPRPGERAAFPTEHFASPRDAAALMFAVTDQTAADDVTACPASATLKACAAGFARLAEARADAVDDDPAALYAELTQAATNGASEVAAVRTRIRAKLVAILHAVARPSFEMYVAKLAGEVARLAELRLHVEVLRAGACPTAADVEQPPFAALRAPAILGASLAARVDADRLEVTPPAGSSKTTWSFRCPH